MLLAPHCANNAQNPASTLKSGLARCVAADDVGDPVKSITMIIITEAPPGT